MEPFEREILLERVEREGHVGVDVPETVDIADDLEGPAPEGHGPEGAFRLRDYVVAATADDAADVGRVVSALRRRRTRLVGRLEEEPMEREQGEALAATVRGIDRALNALDRAADADDLDDEAARKERADQQRWLNFLKTVTGAGDGDDRRRHD